MCRFIIWGASASGLLDVIFKNVVNLSKKFHKFNHLNFYIMKKLNLLLLTLLALWGATATADVVFDETNFPDPNFRNAISYAFEDEMISISYGQVLTDEILSTTMMVFADGYNINSLKGIEYFTGIFHAIFDMNNIDSADFSNNQIMRHLSLRRNPIKSVNIANVKIGDNEVVK